MENGHLKYIDLIKGIGIILVLLFGANVFSVETTATLVTIVPPVFLIGYGAYYRECGIRNNKISIVLKDNFRQYLIPYMWFSILELVIESIKVLKADEYISGFNKDIILSCTLKGIGNIGFLALFFIAVSGYEIIRRKLNIIVTVVMSIVLLAMGLYVAYVFGRIEIPDNLVKYGILAFIYALWRGSICIIYVLIGELLASFLIKADSKKITLGITGVIIAIAGFVLGYRNRGYNLMDLCFGNRAIFICSTILFGAGIIMFARWIGEFRPIEFVGRNAKIMFATFFTCRILWFANTIGDKVFNAVENYFVRRCVIIFICIILEGICIVLCNNVLYFMFGRKSKVKACRKGDAKD